MLPFTIICIVGALFGIAVTGALALILHAMRRAFRGEPAPARFAMPDWLCKIIAIAASWLFALLTAKASILEIQTGICSSRRHDILFAVEPLNFLMHLSGSLLMTALFGIIALGSLGFVPPIGQLYRRLFPKLTARIAEQRRKRESAGQR